MTPIEEEWVRRWLAHSVHQATCWSRVTADGIEHEAHEPGAPHRKCDDALDLIVQFFPDVIIALGALNEQAETSMKNVTAMEGANRW